MGIKQALNVPKTNHLVNDQIRGSGKGTFDAESMNIKSAINTPKVHQESDNQRNHINMAGKFDASALHIQHAVNATRLQKSYKSDGRKIQDFLVSHIWSYSLLLLLLFVKGRRCRRNICRFLALGLFFLLSGIFFICLLSCALTLYFLPPAAVITPFLLFQFVLMFFDL